MDKIRSNLIFSKLKIKGNEIDKAERWRRATPVELMWLRFQKHKLALFSSLILIILYIISFFSGFFAPYDPLKRDSRKIFSPPQQIYFYDSVEKRLDLFVYDVQLLRDPVSLKPVYTPDFNKKQQIKFFVEGDEYKLLGFFDANLHLLGSSSGRVNLLGTDDLGRDLFSRIIFSSQISLFVGLSGVLISFILGSILGGISGFYGGAVDLFIQRVIEFITSIPTIPLWMAISAALPREWTPVQVYFAITSILALTSWGGLARVVRGQLLDLRNEDFVLAARLSGQSQFKIITWHLIPAVMSYLIVNITLSIPHMILGETSLSFLGLGLRPPTISLGVLLSQAQNIRTVSLYPWLMLPAIFVIVIVLCFNFVGDGLRDAADPYSK